MTGEGPQVMTEEKELVIKDLMVSVDFQIRDQLDPKCIFRLKATTDSGPIRPLIPEEPGH